MKTLKNYSLKKTGNKNLFRVIDLNGDWRYYYYKPTKQYLRAVNYILDSGYAKGEWFNKWLKNISADEADKILKHAGDRGDKVHKMISYLLNNKGIANRGTEVWNEEAQATEILSNDEWAYVLTFVEFWTAHSPVLVAEEYATYNLKVGYAGTADFIGILTKECSNPRCPCHNIIGQIGVWDWKTSSGIRDSYGAQVSAYANSDNIKKFDYTAILRLGTRHSSGYEIEIYDQKETFEHWKEFEAALTICNATQKPFDPDKEIYEIPLTISIIIKKQSSPTKKNAKKLG